MVMFRLLPSSLSSPRQITRRCTRRVLASNTPFLPNESFYVNERRGCAPPASPTLRRPPQSNLDAAESNMSSIMAPSAQPPVSTTYNLASNCSQPSPAKPGSQLQHGVAVVFASPGPHARQSDVQWPWPEQASRPEASASADGGMNQSNRRPWPPLPNATHLSVTSASQSPKRAVVSSSCSKSAHNFRMSQKTGRGRRALIAPSHRSTELMPNHSSLTYLSGAASSW
mmetsp:Transcript_31378/g.92334  ORF Transcript_31378/g.92334 Transcript_31378/m.92334 type:complete len:227 (-) Transcript_31378:1304-1984(-)